MRAHACLIILLEEGVHIELPECVCHLCPWISQLKDQHIQSSRHQPLLLHTPSVAPASMPVARSFTHGGVPIVVRAPLRGGRRQASSTYHHALGYRWLSMWSCSPCMGGEPCFSHPFHCGGSPHLLGCTSSQLHQRVRLPCIHDWNTMNWVLSLAPQPSVVRGSNRSPPCLHQRKEANGKVGQAQIPLQKSLLHVGPDRMCGILAQAPMALLVVKEQIGSTQAIHLHVFQLPKHRVTLQYVHDHPCIPGERRRTGPTRADQGGQPSSPLASWRIPLLGSHPSLPQHLPAHRIAPAQKIMGLHPATCTPLGHLGSTSLRNPHAFQSPSQAHNSYN